MNFKSIRQQEHMFDATEKSVENVNIIYRFDNARCFLTNYSHMWFVTLIPGYQNDINGCCSVSSLLTLGIFIT